MRSWNVKALLCAACIVGATACSSDDESTASGALMPFDGPLAASGSGGAGTAGAGGNPGAAGLGGTASAAVGSAGGSGGGGIAGRAGAAGVAGAAAGTAGAAGAAGAGSDNTSGVPDAGAEPPIEELPEEPPVEELPEEPPPAEDVVGFSDVYGLLVTRCGGCHANPAGNLPPFAQADEAASSALVQPGGLADRIYARTVIDRTMPPACRGGDLGNPGCATEEEAALLQAWADGGYQP
jgi:hypothetical protein